MPIVILEIPKHNHLKYVNVYETLKGAPHIYILKPSYLMNFMTHTCSNSLAVRNVCIYFFFSLSKNIFSLLLTLPFK